MPIVVIYLLVVLVPHTNFGPVGLKPGEKAPEFSAVDQNGNEVSLRSALNKGKVVVTFYRGAWCRYCMKQMKDYQDSLSLVTDAGATLIAISPEHHTGIMKTVEKAGVTFSLVHDQDLQIMLDYKVITREKVDEYRRLSQQTKDDISRKFIPVPALYIIGQNGIIDFVSFNPDYTQRLSVKTILANL